MAYSMRRTITAIYVTCREAEDSAHLEMCWTAVKPAAAGAGVVMRS